MKALLVSAAAAGLLIATPAFAQAGPTATANANADAVIVQPIAVVNTSGLNFGRIAADSAASTVTIDSAGGRTGSLPNVLIMTGSNPSAAGFDVTGAAGLAYSITVPATTTLNGPNGNSMVATLNPSKTSGTLSSPAGTDSFSVGGSLAVGANQAAGAYKGSFQVAVQYN